MAQQPFQGGQYPQYGYPYPQAGPSYPVAQPGYPQMNYLASGGYNPYANGSYPPASQQYQTFGQSLFKPTATPEGYSYSAAYTPPPPYQYNNMPVPALPGYNAPMEPSAKRRRIDTDMNPMQGGSGTGAWRNCSMKGCKFVGSAKDVEIHEEDRHLIYAPGRNVVRSEEEERFARRKGCVCLFSGGDW